MSPWAAIAASAEGNYMEYPAEDGGCSVAWHGNGCGRAAIGTLVLGCVHEHLFRYPCCAGCLQRLRRSIGEHGCWCHRCAYGAPSHDCNVHELAWEPA